MQKLVLIYIRLQKIYGLIELRKNSKTISLDTTQENNQDNVDTPMIRILEEEKKNYVYELMNQLEDGCRSILNLSIFQKNLCVRLQKKWDFKMSR